MKVWALPDVTFLTLRDLKCILRSTILLEEWRYFININILLFY